MGTKGTAGFKPNCENYRLGKGITRDRYGIHRYGYGVEKPDLWVTRSKPYLPELSDDQRLIELDKVPPHGQAC